MIAYPQCVDYDFYRSYHLNPYNKAIHLICIPSISICFLNLANHLLGATGDFGVYFFYMMYYFTYGSKVGIVMTIYLTLLYRLAYFWRSNNFNWRENSVNLFIFAWILQFFGHIIEGNRPALMTSIKQSFLEAPLFTVEYIYPSLLELS